MLLAVGYHYVAERAPKEPRAIFPVTTDALAAQIEVLARSFELISRDELLDVVQLESGKARRHAFEEILDTAIVARYYANTAEGYMRSRRRRGALPLLTATWEHHHPLGVVGVISPWNYPLTLSISDSVLALSAGNPVVIKVDSKPPFSALQGVMLLEEAGLPSGLLQVITGSGSELGPELIGRVVYVMFTGSTATGRTVARPTHSRVESVLAVTFCPSPLNTPAVTVAREPIA